MADVVSILGTDVMAGIAICGLIGALIGRARNRVASGLVWGLLLGPIGWLVTVLLKDLGPTCPHCKGTVVAGATKCKNCGSSINAERE